MATWIMRFCVQCGDELDEAEDGDRWRCEMCAWIASFNAEGGEGDGD